MEAAWPVKGVRLPKLTRDALIIGLATAMLVNEAFLSPGKADPTIVYAAVGLYSAPLVLRAGGRSPE